VTSPYRPDARCTDQTAPDLTQRSGAGTATRSASTHASPAKPQPRLSVADVKRLVQQVRREEAKARR
jgi:hypothetical protein